MSQRKHSTLFHSIFTFIAGNSLRDCSVISYFGLLPEKEEAEYYAYTAKVKSNAYVSDQEKRQFSFRTALMYFKLYYFAGVCDEDDALWENRFPPLKLDNSEYLHITPCFGGQLLPNGSILRSIRCECRIIL